MGEEMGKGCIWEIWYKYYMHMYVNGKMRPVETVPGMRGGDDKAE
jgi:hypothetical protein